MYNSHEINTSEAWISSTMEDLTDLSAKYTQQNDPCQNEQTLMSGEIKLLMQKIYS